MSKLSIRLRLTVWYSAVLLTALVLFASGMWFTLQQRLMAELDSKLAQRVQGLRTWLEVEGGKSDDDPGKPGEDRPLGRPELKQEVSEFTKQVPDSTFIQIWDQDGTLVLSSMDEPPAPTPPRQRGYQTIKQNKGSFRGLASRIVYGGKNYAVLGLARLDELESLLTSFWRSLLLMIPAVLAAACLGGYWISRRALAPVDEITQVAKSISIQNLSKRLIVPATGDEIQRMSETWNEVLERLDVAVTRIRQFTADASHELRTPVAFIRATAELALRRERDPQQYRYSLREIENEARCMTELTESLLTLARADSNGVDMSLTSLDLNEIAARAVQQNTPIAQELGILLTADLSPSPATASANEIGIHRILLILIDNALKHTPAGGRITVSTTARADGIQLSVRDTGEGIEPEALSHVFERFYRADKSRGSPGTGLGLSIAQMIARAHGSEIEVDSTTGAGSWFHMIIRS